VSRVPKKHESFFLAGYRAYDGPNEESRQRTTRAAWIALKLGVSVRVAQGYIDEYEARSAKEPTP